MLGLPRDGSALEALARGPEYHEPYHAPIHPRLAERFGLAWAGAGARYRFFHRYFTAAEHAQIYIAGDFGRDFALNHAIHYARTRGDPEVTAALFRTAPALFPSHGQADFWYGRVLHRQGKLGLAAFHYRRARDGARRHPHPVPHRADVVAPTIETWLRRSRKQLAPRQTGGSHVARLTRLEAEEARLLVKSVGSTPASGLLRCRRRGATRDELPLPSRFS